MNKKSLLFCGVTILHAQGMCIEILLLLLLQLYKVSGYFSHAKPVRLFLFTVEKLTADQLGGKEEHFARQGNHLLFNQQRAGLYQTQIHLFLAPVCVDVDGLSGLKVCFRGNWIS